MEGKTATNMRQFVVFKLGEEEYGIDITKVKTIERIMDMTRVPKTPYYVQGIINLRGEVVPVLNLRSKFGMQLADYSQQTRIIILNVNDITFGIIVDSVSEVIYLSVDSIEDTPSISSSISSQFIDGVGKLDSRLIILLNLEKLLEDCELDRQD